MCYKIINAQWPMATLQGVHLLDDSVDCGGGGKTSLGNLAHKGHSFFSGNFPVEKQVHENIREFDVI